MDSKFNDSMLKTAKTIRRLTEESENLSKQLERTRGSLDELVGQLKQNYGCETLDEAEELYGTMEEELEAALEKQKEALAVAEQGAGEKLEVDDEA